MSERVLDRLVKLFALASNNPNANEAKAAILMAQKIMAENAITEDAVRMRGEVNEAKDEIGKSFVFEEDGRQRRDTYASSLGHAIAGFFRVEMWTDRSRVVFAGWGNDRKVAELVYRFALDAMTTGAAKFISAWKVLRDVTPTASETRTERQSWMTGFINGLTEGFREALKANPQWLASTKPPAAVVAWVKANTKLHTLYSFSKTRNGEGAAHGTQAGKNFAAQHSGGRTGAIGALGPKSS